MDVKCFLRATRSPGAPVMGALGRVTTAVGFRIDPVTTRAMGPGVGPTRHNAAGRSTMVVVPRAWANSCSMMVGMLPHHNHPLRGRWFGARAQSRKSNPRHNYEYCYHGLYSK